MVKFFSFSPMCIWVLLQGYLDDLFPFCYCSEDVNTHYYLIYFGLHLILVHMYSVYIYQFLCPKIHQTAEKFVRK